MSGACPEHDTCLGIAVNDIGELCNVYGDVKITSGVLVIKVEVIVVVPNIMTTTSHVYLAIFIQTNSSLDPRIESNIFTNEFIFDLNTESTFSSSLDFRDDSTFSHIHVKPNILLRWTTPMKNSPLIPHTSSSGRALTIEWRIIIEGVVWARPCIISLHSIIVGRVEGKVYTPFIEPTAVTTGIRNTIEEVFVCRHGGKATVEDFLVTFSTLGARTQQDGSRVKWVSISVGRRGLAVLEHCSQESLMSKPFSDFQLSPTRNKCESGLIVIITVLKTH
mmetsp:Transcript_14581/g.23770  ORF Transcript_14581/g.23770 Transcript_14581/m.23770 type:complete len:277 (-) Transcript_14581:1345-2175(-)